MSASSLLSVSISKIPTLKLRKDIWTHFPVCLVKLPEPQEDGRDRYAVQWHQKNLEEWSQNIPAYQTVAKFRLLQSLYQSPKWSVESSKNPTDICLIAMQIPDNSELQTSTSRPLPDIFATDPQIQTLEDLRKYFPICWKSKTNGSVTLEFHCTQLRALAAAHSMSESNLRKHVQTRLTQILKNRWSIELPHERSNQICSVIGL